MMRMVGELAIAIGSSPALSLIAKATLISVGMLAAARIARHSRASVRHLMCATAFIVLLALPLVSAVVPAHQLAIAMPEPGQAIHVAMPPSLGATISHGLDGDAVPDVHPTRPLPTPSTILLVVWLTGTTILVVLMVAGLMHIRRVRRSGLPWRDGQVFVAHIARAMGIRTRIHVLLDETLVGPMTCGVVRPAIVLPRDARQWDMEDLRRAIVHELEHIRRADWLMLCIARTVCALYWFHPLVWILWQQLRLDAERACDDAVLRGADPETYADQLVTLAERLASNKTHSMLAMANRGDLSSRVAAVLDGGQSRGRAGSLWIAMALVAAILLIAGIAPLRAVALPQGVPRVDGSRLTFDVASVKENRSGRIESFAYPYANTGRLVLVNHTVRQMIRQAFDVRDYQLTGGSEWLDRVRYDIEAKAAGPATRQQLMDMLRALLEDKFTLVTRRETREGRVLLLLRVNPGTLSANLTPAQPQDARLNPVGALPDGLRGSAATMADLAATLSNLQGQFVVDRTGLTGIYNFTVTYAVERRAPPGVPLDQLPRQREDLPALPTALREQLGLRLDSARGPIPVLVIESAQQPSVDGYSATAEPVRSARHLQFEVAQ